MILCLWSQSPQAGQFNSYLEMLFVGVRSQLLLVSIPSSGSIQFLLKQVEICLFHKKGSQSPQAGQFNSYREKLINRIVYEFNVSIPSSGSIQFLRFRYKKSKEQYDYVSIPSSGSIQFLLNHQYFRSGNMNYRLNPLKRVNSILTMTKFKPLSDSNKRKVSIPSSGSIQFLRVLHFI